MVSALSRCSLNEFIKQDTAGISIGKGQFTRDKFPCALREFINSNADLPTIDELSKKIPQLAEAIGIFINAHNKD